MRGRRRSSLPLSVFTCSRTSSRMLCPSRMRRSSRASSSGVPLMNSCLNTCVARCCDGTRTPRRFQAASPPPRTSEANRVCPPRCDATSWSSEMPLRMSFGRMLSGWTPVNSPTSAKWPGGVAVRHAREDGEVVAVRLAAPSGSGSARSPCRPSPGRRTGRTSRAVGRRAASAAGRAPSSRPRRRGHHRVEERQPDGDARGAEERAAVEWLERHINSQSPAGRVRAVSLVQKHAALHDLVNQSAEAVILRLAASATICSTTSRSANWMSAPVA